MGEQSNSGQVLNPATGRRPYGSPVLVRCGVLQTVTAAPAVSPLEKPVPSDARLKTAIEPLDGSALSAVMALRPVSYSWIDTGHRQIGFVAQDVEAVLPDAIARPENSDVRHIDFGALISVLTKAVQELQGEVAELREENQRIRHILGGEAKQ